MTNKVLIKLIVPELEVSFDVLVPVNESIWKIKKMLGKAVSDITSTNFNANNYIMTNKDNNKIYKNNDVVINTDIRNGSEIYIFENN